MTSGRTLKSFLTLIGSGRFEAALRRVAGVGPFPKTMKGADLATAIALVEDLPRQRRQEFDSLTAMARGLGDERGCHAIVRAAGSRDEVFDAAIRSHDGPLDSALWCTLEHPDVFARAETIYFAERMRERPKDFVGRFETEPAAGLTADHLDRASMDHAFAAAVTQAGEHCDGIQTEVDLLPAGVDGGGAVLHLTLRRKGRPTSAHIYRGDEPVHESQVPVIETVVTFDPAEGQIEVISERGGPRLRQRIAVAFCEAALGRAPPAVVERLPIDLERLRVRQPFPVSPDDGIEGVRLVEARLATGDAGFVVIGADIGEDLWDTAASFGLREVLEGHGEIARAVIEVTFAPGGAARKGLVRKIILNDPDSVSFPKWPQREKRIAERLLRTWGILGGIAA